MASRDSQQFVQPGVQGNARLKLAESAKPYVLSAASGFSATKCSRMPMSCLPTSGAVDGGQ